MDFNTKLVYASRTGIVQKPAGRLLAADTLKITSGEKAVTEAYILTTYTDGVGIIPPAVEKFLDTNHGGCKGAVSGTRIPSALPQTRLQRSTTSPSRQSLKQMEMPLWRRPAKLLWRGDSAAGDSFFLRSPQTSPVWHRLDKTKGHSCLAVPLYFYVVYLLTQFPVAAHFR